MLIYFDSVILIYLIDHTGAFQTRAAARLKQLEAAGDRIVVSDLTRLECRVRPIRANDAPKLAAFDAFFARPDVLLVALSRSVFDRATDLRAQHHFALADSLHLAAAIEAGCPRLLINDRRLSRCPVLTVEILP